ADHGPLRRAVHRQRLFPEGQRQGPRQQPRAVQARLLSGRVRARAAAAKARPGARDRRLQHGARGDRSRPPERQRQNERLSAGRARGVFSLDRRGLGRYVPRTPSGGERSLHLVAAIGRRAREEYRMANRLRARLPCRGRARPRRVHLAACDGLRPLPGRRRPRLSAIPDRKSTRLNSSHVKISYAVFCLKKKKQINESLPWWLYNHIYEVAPTPQTTTPSIQVSLTHTENLTFDETNSRLLPNSDIAEMHA